MEVVDAVQVHVLRVPRKERLPHPKVEVGCVDALDANADLVLDLVENGAKTVDVPHCLIFVVQRPGDVGTVHWCNE